jgi:exopolyphosphatase/guanosine-5'-triphosphate,3'-diphosphate pyrophosphatase
VSAPAVAVLDIGSNSIKVLVAARGASGGLDILLHKSLDARISAGISAAEPRLSEEGMARGLAAVQQLLALAAPHSPARTLLVATSAVRDAANGADFSERVRAATGHEIRILTGVEEANGIGRGLAADPALADLRDFYVFDLGGGSLECLEFRERQIQQELSLQLGCVRLTEKFVSDPSGPFTAESRALVSAHVAATLRASPLRFRAGTDAVGTGGTVATMRAILGARRGVRAEETEPRVTAQEVAALLDFLAPMSLELRRQVPGLPPARADVFPAALATIAVVAELGSFVAFRHSFYNLRYGLAVDELARLG